MPYLETAVEIAREAGALLANYFERRVAFEVKGEFDLVTEADRASERLVVERLRSHFPSHGIVAEEGGGHDPGAEYCWYVDPLDGTTNFAHGFPAFCVSMGLARAGEIVAGVVFDPMHQEMFTAERGAGAYLNNRRIHVSQTRRMTECLGSSGFPAPQAASQREHPFLLPDGDGFARRAAHRVGRARSGLRGLRAAGPVLGIRT